MSLELTRLKEKSRKTITKNADNPLRVDFLTEILNFKYWLGSGRKSPVGCFPQQVIAEPLPAIKKQT